MIYVVVRESGEYSDYSMQLLFASTSREMAEVRRAKFEEEYRRLDCIYNERDEAYTQCRNDIPDTPPMPYTDYSDLRFFDTPEYKAWNKQNRRHYELIGEAFDKVDREIERKYSLEKGVFDRWYEGATFVIREVESD